MSRAEKQPADVEMGNHRGSHFGRPQSTSSHPSQSQAEPILSDSSAPLFSMYSRVTEEEDNKMAGRWQKDAQGILIFTSLFSVVVAVLITVSVQDLRPNSQDTSAFYLENIYQFLTDPSTSGASIPPTVAKPPAFSPPTYAIWVNALWFLSLVVSLTCALLATLLHQWAHRYMRFTQPVQCSPHKRARRRAFFADGVDAFHTPWVVEALPTMLHLSLFLFLAGLILFLFNVNQTTFNAVVGWVTLFAGIYVCLTLMPIFRYDSPYYTPLSITAWSIYAGILYSVFKVLSLIPGSRENPQPFRGRKNRYREWVLEGVERAADDTASDQSSEVDGRIVEWTVNALDDDDTLQRFFEAIPGFSNSRQVQTRLPSLLRMNIRQVMDGFLDRTFSSESASESIRLTRLTICLEAAHAALGSFVVSRILGNIFDGRWRGVPRSIELGQTLRRWCNSNDEWIALTARSLVASVLAVQERDDRWIALAREQFGLPDRILRDNIPYGDSVLLVILLHVTRELLQVVPPWDSTILRVLSQFDIRSTLPGLQHDFCALWNEIVQEAQNRRPYSAPVFILREIRHLYVALHEGPYTPPTVFSNSTAHGDDAVWQPSSYPSCYVVSHRPDPILHAHGVMAGTGQTPRTSPIAAFPTSPRLHIPLPPVSPTRGHSVHSFLPPNRGLTRRPEWPLGDVPGPSQRRNPPPRASLESRPLLATSPDVAATHATRSSTDISTISFMAPQPPSDGHAALQGNDETIIVRSLVLPVPDSTPSPSQDPIPPVSGGAIPVEPHSTATAESPPSPSDDIISGPPSSSRTPLHPAPQVATPVAGPDDVTASVGIAGTGVQRETDDQDISTPTSPNHRPHPHQSAALGDPGTSESTPRPEDSQRESSQSDP